MENLNIEYNKQQLMKAALRKYKGRLDLAALALGCSPKYIKKTLLNLKQYK